jgi:hypothetical protein
MADDFKRPAILDELDELNTAPEFGMLGILQEEQGATKQEDQVAEPKEERREEPSSQEVDRYGPLNTSIQQLGSVTDARLAEIERKITESRQVEAPQHQGPQYDPQAFVQMEHLKPYQDQLQQANKTANYAMVRSEQLRAHMEYERFKRENPEFALSPKELDVALNRFGNDAGRLSTVNWTEKFEAITKPQRTEELTRLRRENEELKAEKTKWNTRSRNEEPKVPISPQVRSTSRTVTANDNDDDILSLRSFKKGQSFKSFGKDLLRRHGA